MTIFNYLIISTQYQSKITTTTTTKTIMQVVEDLMQVLLPLIQSVQINEV